MNNYQIIDFIYRHHYKYFYVVAFRICEDHNIAQDIVQDGFIKILSSKEEFSDVLHARKYLTGCIKNAAFDCLSKHKREKAIRHDFVTPSNKSVFANLLPHIAGAIASIKDTRAKKILKSRYWDGYTQKKAGVEYNISRAEVA